MFKKLVKKSYRAIKIEIPITSRRNKRGKAGIIGIQCERDWARDIKQKVWIGERGVELSIRVRN